MSPWGCVFEVGRGRILFDCIKIVIAKFEKYDTTNVFV